MKSGGVTALWLSFHFLLLSSHSSSHLIQHLDIFFSKYMLYDILKAWLVAGDYHFHHSKSK